MASTVIDVGARRRRSTAVLVLTDLQREHAVAGRRHAVEGADRVAAACGALLVAAREARFPVAHFRRVGRDFYFHPQTAMSDWLDAVRPRPDEMVFEHELPSCYSCEAFARFMAYVREPLIVLAGFGANYTALATAIDAYSRGHHVRLVQDASGCIAGARYTHEGVTDLIGDFAELTDTREALAMIQGERGPETREHG